MPRITEEELIKSVREIPPLPQVVVKSVKLINDEKSTVNSLADILKQDQGLTTKVLRLANSAFYGFPRKVNTVNEAIVLMGFNTIKGLVMAVGAFGHFNRKSDGYKMEKGELWKHAISTAIAARHIAAKVRYPDIEQAFVGGLLCDIGKVIIDRYLKAEFERVLVLAETQERSFVDAEQELLGFDHTSVGEKILEKWKLPEDLREAVACHHKPELAKINPQLTWVVHVADSLTMMLGFGIGGDGLFYKIDTSKAEALGLTEQDIEKIIDELYEVIEADSDNFMNLN